MTFTLPPLPYAREALSPYISAETIDYHYGKHHQAYVNNLNQLVPGSDYEGLSLEDLILKAQGPIFNNAAQVWNHTFYWHSLAPQAGGDPRGELAGLIEKTFGSFAQFKEKFTQSALSLFGSGWTWLAQNQEGKLEIVNTTNAGNPMTEGKTPLLTCDVWEHAYYIDTRNARATYLQHFWQLVNWNHASSLLKG